MISNKLIKTFLLGSLLISASAALTTGAILSNANNPLEINATDLTEHYRDCESAVAAGSVSSLWTAVKSAANAGYDGGSYDSLFTWYLTTDKKNGKIVDPYSNISNFTSTSQQCGNYNVEGDCYNREHSIPKSWWGGSTSNQGCDIFIVVPTDGKVNGMRSNYPFGEVGTVKSQSSGGYSKLGTSNYSGYSGTVFEPNDEWKGDFARIYFYARAKWNSVSMTSGEGSSTFSGGDTNHHGLTDYGQSLLMKWHKQDPVSQWESERNNKCESVQGNRNPFIDHPEYANYIFGEEPISDSKPTALTINGASSVAINGSITLTVTPTPSDASNSVTWTSSNTSVATISNGVVTGVSAGTTTITATSTVATNVSATKIITVTTPTPVNLTGVTASNVNVKVGQTATIVPTPQPSNAYPIPTYTYSSNSTGVATVSSSGVVTGVSAGSATIIVTATQNSITKSINVTATVSDAPSSASIVPTDLASSYPTSEATYTTASGIKIGAYNTANFSSKIQFKKSGGYLLNIESLSLKKLTIVGQSGTLTVCGGSAKGPTTTKTGSSGVYDLTGCSYFKIINSSGSVATCSSIEIEFGSSPAPTPTVSLNKNSTTLIVGGTETLVATTTGTGTLSWSSNNTGVASVNTSGKITAISAGTATITASYGGATATCVVTVNNSGSTHGESADDPFTVTEALSHIPTSGATDLDSSKTYYVSGLYSSTVTAWSDTNKNMSINVIDPDDTTKVLQFYKMSHTANPNIGTGDTVVASATGDKFSYYSSKSIYELNTCSFVSKTAGDYVTLNKSSTTIVVGGTETLVATASGAVSWSSNNTSVATVSNGIVSAIASGTATITATCGTKSATCTVVVTTSGGGETIKYTKVTSGTVSSGNYLIVYEGGKVAFNGALTTLDVTSNTIAVSISNSEITATTATKAAEFTYDATKGTLKSASGYYIGRTGNSNGLNSSTTQEFTNTLSVSSGDITIKSPDGPVLKYNTTDTRFRYYKSGQTSIQLYKAVQESASYTAENFAADLLIKTNDICKASEQSGWSDVSSQLTSVWAELKGSNCYGKLDSTEISKLASAVASETGTLVEQAMSKYDHIVARYGFESFIAGRTVSSVSPKLFTVDSSSSISIIIIIALVSATAIGGYLILKRRKEQ